MFKLIKTIEYHTPNTEADWWLSALVQSLSDSRGGGKYQLFTWSEGAQIVLILHWWHRMEFDLTDERELKHEIEDALLWFGQTAFI